MGASDETVTMDRGYGDNLEVAKRCRSKSSVPTSKRYNASHRRVTDCVAAAALAYTKFRLRLVYIMTAGIRHEQNNILSSSVL